MVFIAEAVCGWENIRTAVAFEATRERHLRTRQGRPSSILELIEIVSIAEAVCGLESHCMAVGSRPLGGRGTCTPGGAGHHELIEIVVLLRRYATWKATAL